MTYQAHSGDIWEYLGDMPCMPSRADRDILLQSDDPRRVDIWDYFFRINLEDVGKPQKQEMEAVREDLDKDIENHEKEAIKLQSQIQDLVANASAGIKRSFTISVAGLSTAILVILLLTYGANIDSYLVTLCCSAPLWLVGLMMLIRIVRTYSRERIETKRCSTKLAEFINLNRYKVRAARARITALEREIEALKTQIPTPPADSQVRQWLNNDLNDLRNNSIEQTSLSDRLEPIRGLENSSTATLDNPFPIMGPGELQDPQRLPVTFTPDINPDNSKHLSARRAYTIPQSQKVDVLYGMYYIEYIAISEDKLATYGLFYDFITGKSTAEKLTEQYYQDIVAIAMTQQFRKITLNTGAGEGCIHVEDAPTFAISLSSGETREVTFVSKEYFTGIHQELGLQPWQVENIFWIQDANYLAENAISTLRQYLRKHKGGESEDSLQ